MNEQLTTVATAMTGPEVLIEPDVGDIGFRDFGRLDDAVAAGRRAAELALPDLIRTIESPRRVPAIARREIQLRFDPVCAMAISPARARESVTQDGTEYYFCSPNCRDCFVRDPERYIAIPRTTPTPDGQEELR